MKPLVPSHVFPRSFATEYVVIRRAEGIYLIDEDDRAIRTVVRRRGRLAGPCPPAHRRAPPRPGLEVAFTHGFAYVSPPLIDLADRLAAYAGDPRARVLFASGGSEATETALKLARAWHLARCFPSKHRVVSRSVSYHGATIGALSMTGLLGRRRDFEPLLLQFPRAATCS